TVGSIARHDAVADDDMGAVAIASENGEPDDIVFQMDPVEHHGGAAGAHGLDRDPAGRRDAPVVEDDGVGYEELGVAARGKELDPFPRAKRLEIPDHAILDVQGRDRPDVNSDAADALPIDDQAAQADDVAGARVGGDADAKGRDQNARLAGS